MFEVSFAFQVIDKKKGVQECRECDGRGVKVEVVRMGCPGQAEFSRMAGTWWYCMDTDAALD